MGMTMTQKILASASGAAALSAGELVRVPLDLVMGNDITAPVAITEFEKLGAKRVFDKSKVAIVLDHFTPCKDIKSAELCAICRDFAKKTGIDYFFDADTAGIEHVLIPEKGLVTSGDVIIGADSHTCTYGALGAFSTGVGSTDMAYSMICGENWFKVPEAIKVEICGSLSGFATGKDVALTLIGRLGVDGALYKSIEFCGDLSGLSMSDRFCISNMAVEAGAKNAVFAVDDITVSYLEYVKSRKPEIFAADDDARYAQSIKIDLGEITPTVAFPSLPDNIRHFDEIETIPINQVVIGSCTNGRLDDLVHAAQILEGKKIHSGVRCIIIPATKKIWLEALDAGLLKIFAEAGAIVSTPTCGPCLGGFMGILAEGERCVSTTNRNFIGRMGHKKSEVYLASPFVAAQSAVDGVLSCPVGE